MKKIYSIVLDTETCPLDRDLEEVVPSNMWTYDFGYIVRDRKGNIYEKRSFIIYDIYVGEKTCMNSAYYKNKIPMYEADLKKGSRKMVTFNTARKIFLEDIKKYNVTECFAHNMRFDYGTLNTTIRWITKSKMRYFFPYGIKICDTLKMSRQVLNTPTYKKWCVKNNELTKRKQPKMTAESLYKFITKNTEFKESHTALEDVLIESEILTACFKKHKKLQPLLWA